jgi:hypothetical protein
MEIHIPCSWIGRPNNEIDTPQTYLQIQYNLYQNTAAFLQKLTR